MAGAGIVVAERVMLSEESLYLRYWGYGNCERSAGSCGRAGGRWGANVGSCYNVGCWLN